MANDWSKQRRRDQTRTAKRQDVEIARILAEDRPVPPSKAELRAQANAAIADHRRAIDKLPTVVEVKCYRCNHRGRIKVYDVNARFRCSKCGALSLKL
jgi:hypothetical protein